MASRRRGGIVRRKSFFQQADLKKEMSTHKDDDIKVGEMWSEIFKDKDKQKDEATLQFFWDEMKRRIIRRWGTISEAFRDIDFSGDGQINFLEFNGLLKLVHIPMESRAARVVFSFASESSTEIDLNKLKMKLLLETWKKMRRMIQTYKKRYDRTRKHIQNFLLALSCRDQPLRMGTIDRMQRKFTAVFCRDVFEKLKLNKTINDRILNLPIHEVKVERILLLDLESALTGPLEPTTIASHIQPYQFPFLIHVFERVGKYKGYSVLLIDLMTTLVLLSPDSDRKGKLQLLFEVCDTDYDGVLTHEQIKNLFYWICRTRCEFDGRTVCEQDSGDDFQEELSEQEGQRHYECARWRLLRNGHTEGTVTWEELWNAIQDQPDVINSLVPGAPFIHWAFEPSPLHNSRASCYRSFIGTELGQPVPARRGATLQMGNGHGNYPIRAETPQAAPTGSLETKPGSRQRLRRQSTAPPGLIGKQPQALGGLIQAAGNSTFAWPEFSDNRNRYLESSQFRKDLTDRFKSRLRKLGNERLAELSEPAFNNSSPRACDELETSIGSSVPNSRVSSANPSSSTFSRPASGASLFSLPRLGSRGHSSQGSRKQSSIGFPRLTSANSTGGASLMDFSSSMVDDAASTIERLPLEDSLSEQGVVKWGIESLGRYRLLVEAHATDKSACHRSLFPPDCLAPFGYRCALCNTSHALNPQEA